MSTNHDNVNPEQNQARYAIIDGKKISLSTEQQKAWYDMVNKVRRYARNFGTCAQPDFRKCYGDCSLCPFQCEGTFVYADDHDRYMDGFATGKYAPAYHQKSVAQQIEEEDTWNWLYHEADKTVKRGRDILYLSFQEGLSAHQIANRTGIAKSTVVDRLNKLLAFIREHREDLV